jgi:hypothetical protein
MEESIAAKDFAVGRRLVILLHFLARLGAGDPLIEAVARAVLEATAPTPGRGWLEMD